MRMDKKIERLLSKPKDYTFEEARSLMESLGYRLCNKGSTSGSRVMFYRECDEHKIMLHRPHPQSTMPAYAVKQMIEALREGGDIDG